MTTCNSSWGARDLFEKAQELLMAAPHQAVPGDLAGGDLERSEQGRGAVSGVVVGAPPGQPGLHRQD